MKKIKMYVVGHKMFNPPKDDIYYPIQVGKQFTKNELGFLSDDIGDNISDKNKTFCELTAVYWIWKNDIDADVVGLCHYRRYYSKSKLFANQRYFLNRNDIENILKKYDVIVTEKMSWHVSVREFYSLCEGKDKDLEATRHIICKKYPEYIDSFDKIMNGNSAFYCNMVICPKEKWNKYCEWLFDILFDLESQLDLSSYTVEEARVFGYLSELLLNVWIDHNKLTYKEVPMVNTEYSFKHRLKRYFLRLVKIDRK